MNKTEVKFRDLEGNERIGTIEDKIRVMQLGGNASYDNYLILEKDSNLYFVGSPFGLIRKIEIPIPVKDYGIEPQRDGENDEAFERRKKLVHHKE